MKEAVRSGRRANFYITENSFIDHYAREVGTTGIAVYHTLARYANCETRSTWVGTARVADLLGVDQRTVQRALKKLESLNLIRIIRSSSMTTYYLVPVPSRPKTADVIPLFDQIPDHELAVVEEATPMSHPASSLSHMTAFSSPVTTTTSHLATSHSFTRDTCVTAYKEEQNLGNKTFEQEYFSEQEILTAYENANRIIDRLKKGNDTSNVSIDFDTVVDIVKREVKYTGRPMSGSVARITTAWDRARGYGVSPETFLENFIPRLLAKEVIETLQLAAANPLISTIAEAVKA